MLEGLNILIAEDLPLNQKVLQYMLRQRGAAVTGVENGRDAIDSIRQNRFDLVLMDIQMPEMDGLEAIQRIREELKSNIPVIGITAGINDEESKTALKLGMNACLAKPLQPDTLCELILLETKSR